MTAVLKRCPFTLLMVAALIAAGIYSQTHVGLIEAKFRQQVGYSVQLLFAGHLHRLFTSVFFTEGAWLFYGSLVMLAVILSWVEYVYGTFHTVLTFFGVHLATLVLLVFVAWPLTLLETHHGDLLFDARDVGPSAGYYGCLGLAVAGLTSSKRKAILVAIVVVLVLRLVWSTLHVSDQGHQISADLAHLIAFPLGMLSHRFVKRPVECDQ